jgi:hypothetical protein
VTSAVTGKVLRLKAISVGASTATVIQLYSDTGSSAPIGGPISIPTNGSVTVDEQTLGPAVATAVGKGLYAGSSATATVTFLLRIERSKP